MMKEKDYRQIADNIRKYRLLHKMTQAQMAEEMDLDAQYYAHLEQGVKHFTLDRIMDACEIFHVRIEDIVKSPKATPEDCSQQLSEINEKLLTSSYKQLLLINSLIDQVKNFPLD